MKNDMRNIASLCFAMMAAACAPDPGGGGEDTGDDVMVPAGSGETRATDQLLADWDFEAGNGNLVDDISPIQNKLPLTIKDPTAVTWGDGFLTINSPTVLEARTDAGKIPREVQLSGAITIEAWVAAEGMEQGGPAQIVGLSRGPEDRDFFLGQAGPSLQLNLSYIDVAQAPLVGALYTEPVTTMGELTHLVYTRDPNGLTRFYVNGELDAEGEALGSIAWPANGVVALGNSVGSENRPWLGSYYRVAMYARALNADEVAKHHGIGP